MVGLGSSDSLRGIFSTIFQEHFSLTTTQLGLIHRLERFGHGGKQFAEFDELVIVQRFFVGIAHRVVDGSATFLFWKASSS